MNVDSKGVFSLGMDLGTSSCKVCLLDGKGTSVASTSAGYPTFSPHAGWMEQNSQTWIDATIKATRTLADEFPEECRQLQVITLTSAAHIGVILNEHMQPIRPAILYSDQRAQQEVAELAPLADTVFTIGANKPSTSWTLPHLLWIRKQENKNWKATKWIALSKDYLLYWLSGSWATDPGTAVSALLSNAQQNSWSSELCDLCDVRTDMLPPIHKASAIVGALSAAPAKLLGLPSGIPIVVGTLDSATETYGAQATSVNDLVIRIGTAGGIHRVTAQPLQDRRLLTYPFPIKSLWYSQAGTNAAGAAIGWAVQAMGKELSKKNFDDFDDLAEKAPAASDGLLFHPFLAGERTPYWNANLRGTYSFISHKHTSAHMARAVLEGVAFSLMDALAVLSSIASLPEEIKVVGGGASDPLLMRILSSLVQRPLRALKSVDSAYGAALFGLNEGLGHMNNDFETVMGTVFQPVQEWIPKYIDAFEHYKDLCLDLQNMYNRAKLSKMDEA